MKARSAPEYGLMLLAGLVGGWVAFASLGAVEAFAHGGGLDGNGGHYNRKTGEYHYHGGGSKSKNSPAPSRPKTSGSSSSQHLVTTSSYSDNTVRVTLEGRPEVSISSLDDPDSGRFIITKTGPNHYALTYRAEDLSAAVTTHFTAKAKDIEKFSEALADVVEAELE